jgi:hypothetical protein
MSDRERDRAAVDLYCLPARRAGMTLVERATQITEWAKEAAARVDAWKEGAGDTCPADELDALECDIGRCMARVLDTPRGRRPRVVPGDVPSYDYLNTLDLAELHWLYTYYTDSLVDLGWSLETLVGAWRAHKENFPLAAHGVLIDAIHDILDEVASISLDVYACIARKKAQ